MNRPAVLLACGSFNPPTHMHLRLFELARDGLISKGVPVLGGVISPVNDGYGKKGLLPAHHRLKMVNLAVQNYDLVKCSPWETQQTEWSRTRAVLDHYQEQITKFCQGQQDKEEWMPDTVDHNTTEEIPRLMLICGGDMLESFSVPKLWLEQDITVIARDYGLVVISREGTNPDKYVYEHDILHKYKDNIYLVTERIPNDISSTGVRRAVQRGKSVRFLLPDPVIDYIAQNDLYRCTSNEDIDFENK